jgi:hypothetical protein
MLVSKSAEFELLPLGQLNLRLSKDSIGETSADFIEGHREIIGP